MANRISNLFSAQPSKLNISSSQNSGRGNSGASLMEDFQTALSKFRLASDKTSQASTTTSKTTSGKRAKSSEEDDKTDASEQDGTRTTAADAKKSSHTHKTRKNAKPAQGADAVDQSDGDETVDAAKSADSTTTAVTTAKTDDTDAVDAVDVAEPKVADPTKPAAKSTTDDAADALAALAQAIAQPVAKPQSTDAANENGGKDLEEENANAKTSAVTPALPGSAKPAAAKLSPRSPVKTANVADAQEPDADVDAIPSNATSVDATNEDSFTEDAAVSADATATSKDVQDAQTPARPATPLLPASQVPPNVTPEATPKKSAATTKPTDGNVDSDANSQLIEAINQLSAGDDSSDGVKSKDEKPTAAVASILNPGASTDKLAARVMPGASSKIPADVRFADANHPTIVAAVKTELLPRGGSMQIRLDPPELGALQVTVKMTDAGITASFQTSNDEATKLLSHSLSQLKSVLESQGVSVERLHVEQAPRNEQSNARGSDDPRQQQQSPQEQQQARQDNERREMLQRMWNKLVTGDPLDLVA